MSLNAGDLPNEFRSEDFRNRNPTLGSQPFISECLNLISPVKQQTLQKNIGKTWVQN